jgi:hypothetical protein
MQQLNEQNSQAVKTESMRSTLHERVPGVFRVEPPVRFVECSIDWDISAIDCRERYANGRMAVLALNAENEEMALLSVNLPDAKRLKEGCFFLRDWTKNARPVQALIDAGVIEVIEVIPDGLESGDDAKIARLCFTPSEHSKPDGEKDEMPLGQIQFHREMPRLVSLSDAYYAIRRHELGIPQAGLPESLHDLAIGESRDTGCIVSYHVSEDSHVFKVVTSSAFGQTRVAMANETPFEDCPSAVNDLPDKCEASE